MGLLHQIYLLYFKSDPKQADIDNYLLEELSELQTEIHHFRRLRSIRSDVAKEVKDVEILLYQFKMKYDLFGLVETAIEEELSNVPTKIINWKLWKRAAKKEKRGDQDYTIKITG